MYINVGTIELESPIEWKEEPLLIFGVFSDIQYADRIPEWNRIRTDLRYYRNSLNALKNAYRIWESDEDNKRFRFNCEKRRQNPKPDFVVNLGNNIDKWNKKQEKCLDVLMSLNNITNNSKIPIINIWGNHDLYCFKRSLLYMNDMLPLLATNLSESIAFQIYNKSKSSPNICPLSSTSFFRRTFEYFWKRSSKLDLVVRDESTNSKVNGNKFDGYWSLLIERSTRWNSVKNSWKFLFLDTFEISNLGYKSEEEPYLEFANLLFHWQNLTRNFLLSRG